MGDVKTTSIFYTVSASTALHVTALIKPFLLVELAPRQGCQENHTTIMSHIRSGTLNFMIWLTLFKNRINHLTT